MNGLETMQGWRQLREPGCVGIGITQGTQYGSVATGQYIRREMDTHIQQPLAARRFRARTVIFKMRVRCIVDPAVIII